MIEGLIGGFGDVFQPWNLLAVFMGTALGLLVGALPGLSSPMAIVILLPVTYTMEPLPALLTMIGVYVGTKLGGSYSAILLRTPGTPAAACTALDGHPMAESGRAGQALGYATIGSTFRRLVRLGDRRCLHSSSGTSRLTVQQCGYRTYRRTGPADGFVIRTRFPRCAG